MKERKQLSLIIIIVGLALFFSYHIYYHFVNNVNDELIENYYSSKNNIDTNTKNTLQKVIYMEDDEEYIGVVKIPKIKLKEGFYSKNSTKNNVNNSVTLLNESIMPEDDGSIIYLAAHSGSGYLAFFKNINKLNYGDMIYLSYNSNNYTYTVTDIYEIVKDGKITVKRNTNEKYLILTTCSKNKNMQTIIVSKMLNKV